MKHRLVLHAETRSGLASGQRMPGNAQYITRTIKKLHKSPRSPLNNSKESIGAKQTALLLKEPGRRHHNASYGAGIQGRSYDRRQASDSGREYISFRSLKRAKYPPDYQITAQSSLGTRERPANWVRA